MNAISIAVLAAVGAGLFAALRRMRKTGGCGCGCTRCSREHCAKRRP